MAARARRPVRIIRETPETYAAALIALAKLGIVSLVLAGTMPADPYWKSYWYHQWDQFQYWRDGALDSSLITHH